MSLEFYSTEDLSPTLLREITEFLDSQDTGHPFQFPQWNVSGARFVLLRQGGSIRWFGTFGLHAHLGPAFPQIRAIIANRGPVCDDSGLWQATTEDFAEEMSHDNYTYLDAAPDWVQVPGTNIENGFRDSDWQQLSGERTSLRLDLTKNEDEIFASFRKNSRYEVRRAERLGVSVVPASCDSEIEEFLSLHSGLANRKSFPAEVPNHMRASIRWLISGKSRGALLLARAENTTCGGAVIGRSGKRCWYVWGAADKHDRFNVGHFLQWKALLWAKSQACDEYDFGGYTPGATSGPAWFKAGFGGTVVRFVPARRKVFRPACYRLSQFAFRVRELKGSRSMSWLKKSMATSSVSATLNEK